LINGLKVLNFETNPVIFIGNGKMVGMNGREIIGMKMISVQLGMG